MNCYDIITCEFVFLQKWKKIATIKAFLYTYRLTKQVHWKPIETRKKKMKVVERHSRLCEGDWTNLFNCHLQKTPDPPVKLVTNSVRLRSSTVNISQNSLPAATSQRLPPVGLEGPLQSDLFFFFTHWYIYSLSRTEVGKYFVLWATSVSKMGAWSVCDDPFRTRKMIFGI